MRKQIEGSSIFFAPYHGIFHIENLISITILMKFSKDLENRSYFVGFLLKYHFDFFRIHDFEAAKTKISQYNY